VCTATVASSVRLDDRHALATVAAMVASGRAGLRRVVVTVPIARDDTGGLAVDDLPSFSSAPARATIGAAQAGLLFGDERAAIEGVLRPFLRAYLAGDTAGLAYLVPPGARIAAAAGRWELLDLTSMTAGPTTPAGRVVLVGVQARDARTGATYALRYRVRLVKRERWYVAQVNGQGAG
jgi:Conjugative transposon protein TcpC